MLIEIAIWAVMIVALLVGTYYGTQAMRAWHVLVGRGQITRWRLSFETVFAHPELSQPYMRASAAGVVAAFCVIYLFNKSM